MKESEPAAPPWTVKNWLTDIARGWDRFWFTPTLPHTLAVIRIACGGMLAYIHVIWASLIGDFLGEYAWIDQATIHNLHRNDWVWSWLFYVESPTILWAHQLVAILASLLMMLGLFTRVAIPVALWMTLMVCHRMTGALFGLDQVVVMLATYLVWARSGSVFSLDAWLRDRRGVSFWRPTAEPAVSNNIATRLIQLHLCVIYLFGGLSKMRGEMWWDGSALWYAAVSYEYQTLDLTWLGHFPWIIALLSGVTIFWETFYPAIVWPRATRPVALALAVFVHGGIAVALGMITFGTIMIVANFSFISPQTVQRWAESLKRGR